MICKRNICIYLAFIIIALTLFLNIKKGGSSYGHPIKRGYLLDRNGEPLVINKESFQAYYIHRGRSVVGKDIPDELRAYLPPYFELPEKGLVLISGSLTYEEIQKFKRIENVIIKGEVKRTPLLEELRALVGSVSENEGISGLEKAFNSRLKAGESQNLSLDLKLCRRVYEFQKGGFERGLQNIAVFRLNTGELLVFLSKEEKNFLVETIAVSPKDLELEISEVVWELGSLEVKKRDSYLVITPLHVVKGYLRKYCEAEINPTLLPRREPVCEPPQEQPEPLFLVIPERRKWYLFLLKNENLYILSGLLPEEVKDGEIDWERFKTNLLKYSMVAL